MVEAEWFVANIPYEATKAKFEDFIRGILGHYGVVVEDVRFMHDEKQEFRGFGFLSVLVPPGVVETEIFRQVSGPEFEAECETECDTRRTRKIALRKAHPRPPLPEHLAGRSSAT